MSPQTVDLSTLVKTAWSAVSSGALPPSDVTKLMISKLLGYGMIVGACITKVPQIQNVLKARSAEGLSALSFELETLGLLVHTSYGYLTEMPFNAYGEAAVLASQSLVLLALIYRYANTPRARVSLMTALYAGLIGVVLSGRVTKPIIARVFEANNLLFMVARVPQIAKNFSAKSTGQLSIFTYAINTVGCVARIFTTLQEGGGPAMLRGFIISLLLNLTLVSQILLYGNKEPVGAIKRSKTPTKKEGKKEQ